ncbi:MAG TPA: phage terminase large subunit family protein [Syntrophomonadaceae bacterium]|nr:phage terminase large subunit family protein [Syntrophomonadaceae bacterium]
MGLVKDLVGTSQAGISFEEYCSRHIVLDDRSPYLVNSRAFMADIIQAIFSHPHVTIEKGAQTGFSTLFLAHSFYMVDIREANAIYYLPNDKLANRFGQTRLDPYVDRSKYLKSRLLGTDQAGLKQIGTHFFYLLGLFSKSGAISIPADEILFDEVALINRENMELAEDRILASKLGWQRYFSAPIYEEDGIDELYHQSDMQKWIVTCENCGRESILEEEFPDNMQDDRLNGGKVFLYCVQCGKPLDVDQGCWTPEHPERIGLRGYRAPQLAIKEARLDLIWDRWIKALGKPNKIARFRRSVLAIADSGDMQPIGSKVLEIVEAASDYYFQDTSDVPCGIGIDMGDLAHIAVLAPFEEGFRIIAAWHVDVEILLEMIPGLEAAYNAGCLIIDAMPYKTESKRVVRVLDKATGFIQYFKGTYKETTEGEDEKEVRVIQVDRDESLDETTSLFGTNPPQALLFKPRTVEEEKTLDEIKRHLKKLVKEEGVGADGQKRLSYKKNVENHFGMAINSARLALDFLSGGRRQQGGITGGKVVGKNIASEINW